jgi:hypothetical protein
MADILLSGQLHGGLGREPDFVPRVNLVVNEGYLLSIDRQTSLGEAAAMWDLKRYSVGHCFE